MNSTYTLKNKYAFPKHVDLKNTHKKLFIISISVLLFVVLINIIQYEESSRIKNIHVIELKENINKLMYSSLLLETFRTNGQSKGIEPFGGLNYVSPEQLNNNLKISLLNSKVKIENLGIMTLNPILYQQMLKGLHLGSLITDNNLAHYVVITKGNKAGTVLYNGPMKFIDGNNRQYFGLELFVKI